MCDNFGCCGCAIYFINVFLFSMCVVAFNLCYLRFMFVLNIFSNYSSIHLSILIKISDVYIKVFGRDFESLIIVIQPEAYHSECETNHLKCLILYFVGVSNCRLSRIQTAFSTMRSEFARDSVPFLPITVIGSYPKPSYLKVPSWFDGKAQHDYNPNSFNDFVKTTHVSQREKDLEQALHEILSDQHSLGVNIVTDGELDRENYIYYHCRHLNGFDFTNLRKKLMRTGAVTHIVPVIVGKISSKKDNFFITQWKRSQSIMKKINDKDGKKLQASFVKYTIPGPMTIADSVYNDYYSNENELLWDLACAINEDITNLVLNTNIKHIQIDEPLFARKPDLAKKIGFKCLARCLKGIKNINGGIITTVHICCGYTDYLNELNYKKADNNSYVQLAKYGLGNVDGIDYVSIEDTHSRVPLEFFKLIRSKDSDIGVVLGCLAVCKDEIETCDSIVNRVCQIVDETGFDSNKLILAPDCGLAMMTVETAKQKLKVLNDARNVLQIKLQNNYSAKKQSINKNILSKL